MKLLIMIQKTDGTGFYLMETQGRKILPVFDSHRDAEEFMAGWKVDKGQYRPTPAMTFGYVDEVARDLKEQGVDSWTFPPANPREPLLWIPINHLERQS